MIVELDNKKLVVKFRKMLRDVKQYSSKHERTVVKTAIDTICEMYYRGQDEMLHYVGVGKAKQHVKDKYDKILGKRYALGRALENSEHLTKEDKRKIMDSFGLEFVK